MHGIHLLDLPHEILLFLLEACKVHNVLLQLAFELCLLAPGPERPLSALHVEPRATQFAPSGWCAQGGMSAEFEGEK